MSYSSQPFILLFSSSSLPRRARQRSPSTCQSTDRVSWHRGQQCPGHWGCYRDDSDSMCRLIHQKKLYRHHLNPLVFWIHQILTAQHVSAIHGLIEGQWSPIVSFDLFVFFHRQVICLWLILYIIQQTFIVLGYCSEKATAYNGTYYVIRVSTACGLLIPFTFFLLHLGWTMLWLLAEVKPLIDRVRSSFFDIRLTKDTLVTNDVLRLSRVSVKGVWVEQRLTIGLLIFISSSRRLTSGNRSLL